MKRLRLVASVVTALLVAVAVALLVIAVIGNRQVADKQAGLSQALSRTQSALEKSAKDSANTRITTVTQRCNFTRLVTNVLVRQDPQVAAPFQRSLAGCLAQLAVVKKIAASAPTTTK